MGVCKSQKHLQQSIKKVINALKEKYNNMMSDYENVFEGPEYP